MNALLVLVLQCLLFGFSFGSSKDQTATVIFVGDISFDGPVKYFTKVAKTCSYNSSFEKIRKFLADADLRVGNLESSLVRSCKPYRAGLQGKTILHCSEVRSVEGLRFAGFDLLQLANNHFADYGNEGMQSTMKTLEDAGIDFVGVRRTSDAKLGQKPIIKIVNGIRIGFLAYCDNSEGCALQHGLYKYEPVIFNKKQVAKDIKKLRKLVDFIVVLMHWGFEFVPVPAKRQRNIAKYLQVTGADLVIGNHPHVTEGHSCIGATMVVYSLGNFLFAKHGIPAIPKMLGGKVPSKKDIDEYLSEVENVHNPTQYSYMFRVKLNRDGILDAHYLQLNLINNPKTNCLQPTPITNRWERFCDEYDLFCYKQTLFNPEDVLKGFFRSGGLKCLL